jgi:hypothetical protein
LGLGTLKLANKILSPATEAANADGEKFGESRLLETLASHSQLEVRSDQSDLPPTH